MDSSVTHVAHPRRELLIALLWGGLVTIVAWASFFHILGQTDAVVAEIVYFVIVLGSLAWLHLGNAPLRALTWLHIVCVFALCLTNTYLAGGFVNSGGFVVWSVIAPTAAAVFLGGRAAAFVFIAFVAELAVAMAVPERPGVPLLSKEASAWLGAGGILGLSSLVAITLSYFVRRVAVDEAALRESKERFQAILDTTPAAIFTQDQEGRFTLVNTVLTEIVGKPDSTLLGHVPAEIFGPEMVRDPEATRRKALLSGTQEALEVTLPPEYGALTFLVAYSPLRDATGQICATCGVATDITARARLQDEVLRSQKLESLGTLAGGIAHDFNNILMAFAGNLALALEHVGEPEPLRDHLERSLRALGQARQLARQLLTFSRGGGPVLATTEVSDAIRDSAAFVLRGTTSRCEFDIPEGLCAVEADVGQLGQMLGNLVLNAHQAMPGGGVITIRCRNISAGHGISGLDPDRAYVAVSVEDEGEGIPPEHSDRIFDPYFTTRADGRGFGLASCHSIAKGHGGRITFENREEGGAAFHVYLPASRHPVAGAEQPNVERLLGRGRVLVMDDEPGVRDVLAAMLKRLGYAVEVTRDGAAAVERYREAASRQEPFDAVILDLTVPGGVGGVAAAADIRAFDTAAVLIASSGYSDDPVLARPAEWGFRGALMKPYSLADLGAVLQNARSAAVSGAQQVPSSGESPSGSGSATSG